MPASTDSSEWVPCSAPVSDSPSTSSQSTWNSSPRRRASRPAALRPPAERTASLVITQSRARFCSIAASTIVTCWPVLDEADRAVEQAGQHEQLVVAGLEPAHVHGARCEHDGAGLDRGDPAHRDEDAVPVLYLDDQTEHARRLAVDPQCRDGLADPAELVTIRVKYANARQPGDKHPAGRGHVAAPIEVMRSPRRCRPVAG